ncbi:hypothetical protein [Methylocystis echinoides]|uniref:DUF4189 domain-containing protein n=1 Tax=Methylocystis echinoides TaxID=29468 RepID=A0A9W6GVE0_9HYPH|nr:hypothetical protein [Methylocystis echinoides]GLI93570.1 hypothetical protein LMG27198_25620 [Methylocystis echinoides]
MKKTILVTSLLVMSVGVMSVGAATARGGQQTWILVCSDGVPKNECNLTTAARWYHLSAPQASASTPAIKAARAKVAQSLDKGFYVAQEQFPAGVSMGERGRIFKACDPESATPPADSQQAEWARRGSCLE